MQKSRLEAFSDGVIAIIITIMVLELKAPEADGSLRPLLPVFLSYMLSFIYVGIYWNNHHNLFQVTQRVNGATLWANLHLLFWLSLIPFVTGWSGNTNFGREAAIAYGIVLILCALAWAILTKVLRSFHGPKAQVSLALQNDRKEKLSILLYFSGIMLALRYPLGSFLLYALVATLWIIPDRRLESTLIASNHSFSQRSSSTQDEVPPLSEALPSNDEKRVSS